MVLSTHVTPFASSLTVDGEAQGENKKQFKLTLPAGRHKIVAKHPSLGTKEWNVDLAANAEIRL